MATALSISIINYYSTEYYFTNYNDTVSNLTIAAVGTISCINYINSDRFLAPFVTFWSINDPVMLMRCQAYRSSVCICIHPPSTRSPTPPIQAFRPKIPQWLRAAGES